MRLGNRKTICCRWLSRWNLRPTTLGLKTTAKTNGLSQAILDYIAANYPGWVIDDIDLIRTPTDQYYEIELEKRGEPDVTIFIRADGSLIN